ncbi:hypothetical protein CONLIGDRAFT_685001 [Coniochaeta ligniaria NRRL 30616]|uniref:Uncharacterized protein n=1 Tax=Coniochaeta ligniaria NRRL 30616 TaxID=1408157 RepID=A0A1J7IVJ5_9PEZI|nr:hypothetical protein CONLIGDRAFT_685001 [Coniochaeta ligniaria NRRL 30616]
MNLSGLTTHISAYKAQAQAQLQKAKDAVMASELPGLLGQAALTTGINFVLPLLLAQLAPKLGFGGAGGSIGRAGTGALPMAAAAAADEVDFGQVVNLNYFIHHMGAMYMQENTMLSYGTLHDAGGDFSMTDWILNCIENVAMPLADLVDIILD